MLVRTKQARPDGARALAEASVLSPAQANTVRSRSRVMPECIRRRLTTYPVQADTMHAQQQTAPV